MRQISDTYYFADYDNYIRQFPEDVEAGTWTVCCDGQMRIAHSLDNAKAMYEHMSERKENRNESGI